MKTSTFHARSFVLFAALLLLLAGVAVVVAAPPTERLQIHVAPESVRLEFERFAREMPYLHLDSVVWDRDSDVLQRFDPQQHKLHYQILDKIAAPRFTIEALIGLLSHDDAKVRTLAIAAMFDRADPSVLPHLMRLSNDDAPTFHAYRESGGALPVFPPMPPEKVEQTVATFAEQYVQRYCYRDFAKYWAERKDRRTCASWFHIDYRRATQGTSPVPEHRRPHAEAVWKRIEEIPGDDAIWTALYLHGEVGLYGEAGTVNRSDAEMLRRCKTLGREKILLALQRKLPSSDPDLKHGFGPYPLRFLLRHAKELLLPEDADLLLQCERRDAEKPDWPKSGSWPQTGWFLAASDLRPDRTSEIVRTGLTCLKGEFDHYTGPRGELIERLWRVDGEKEAAYIVEWFFGERMGKFNDSDPRDYFLQQVFDSKQPEFRRLTARLVGDPRLPTLDPLALCALAVTVAAWTPEPIIGHADEQQFRHDADLRSHENAATRYPEQMRRYEATRKKLIADLQAGLPKWAPDK